MRLFDSVYLAVFGPECGIRLIYKSLHVGTRDGTVIIPADGSYVRYISNTWYDGVDTENL
jgi:hypothetical protein